MEYLSEEEKKRAKDCVYVIQDNLYAIINELSLNMSYKGYIAEKLEPIKNDINCLISMCEGDK